MRDIQVSPIPYIWRYCELRNGMFGMGFMGSGGSLGDEGYTITIPGAVITGGGPGVFNETTGTSGVIGTATTNLGGTLTWSIVAGGDARISINSSTGAVSASSAIYSGSSAAFTVRVTNGTLTIGFPFTAVGTIVDTSWILSGAMIDVDYENDRAYLYGVGYASVAAARTAGVIVQTSSIDRITLTGLASIYTIAAKGTTHSATVVGQTARYIMALDDTTSSNLIYFAQYDNAGAANLRHSIIRTGTDQAPPTLGTATGAGTSAAVRYASRIQANSVAVSFGGAAVTSDTGVTLPTVTQIVVGNRHDAARPWLGTVKRVALVNATTSDANLPNIFA